MFLEVNKGIILSPDSFIGRNWEGVWYFNRFNKQGDDFFIAQIVAAFTNESLFCIWESKTFHDGYDWYYANWKSCF